MGSCISSSSKSPLQDLPPNKVRIVHLDGLVEDFNHPVFVDQLITSKPPKHFICMPAQLLSSFSQPMAMNSKLEMGQLYFLLPFSTLQADISPVNLASLVKKLMEKANANRGAELKGPTRSPAGGFVGSGLLMESRGKRSMRVYEPEVGSMVYLRPRAVRSWRPALDSIRESSFHRRSESVDL
ncbi:hypothetical protein SAY86_027422 [Trapa natans]|uniref:Uncharacterized protein n=1 Tax=Trapa natans TaxID=22666 RepID=A0AAN7KMC6_TRANT|nr:hypothetical protein SAY86_027422 [Trapa natans]